MSRWTWSCPARIHRSLGISKRRNLISPLPRLKDVFIYYGLNIWSWIRTSEGRGGSASSAFFFFFPPPHSLYTNSYFFEVKYSLYGKLPFLALGSASGRQLATLKRKSHEEIRWRNIWTRLDTSGHCPNTSKMSGGGKDRALPQQQARKGQKQKGIFLRYFKVRCQNIR